MSVHHFVNVWLLRHGKAEDKEFGQTDLERRLNEQGAWQSRLMGKYAESEHFHFDRILCSPALRARETAEAFLDAFGAKHRLEIEIRDSLYAEGIQGYLKALKELPKECRSCLIVGHNPDLEDLAYFWSGEPTGFGTANLCKIRIEGHTWPDLANDSSAGNGELEALFTPQDIAIWQVNDMSPQP